MRHVAGSVKDTRKEAEKCTCTIQLISPGRQCRHSVFHQCHCDGLDRADPHTTVTSADSTHGILDTTRRAGLPIGSLQCPREGGAILGKAQKCRERLFWSGTLEEPTSKRTRETGGDQGGAVAGDVREGSSEELTPSQSQPLDGHRWPRGAHA
ncbi:hypothetical protein NDU88_005167 [Pleurodeles waltl]|uniref:Uncharacterized protein n=1 Tax=Pleurodeles waltl TaxID=8319 RepID=A0AAV7MG35_PLEWA|nr:hypothetical protein NDU88_005167 [Pleurodeles waltl]